MSMQNNKKTLIGLLLVLALAAPAWAGVEQIVSDFKPLAAYVVMEMQGEYIIDKDASHGVRAGDIFAAVSAGKQIVHPVTGEVLGTLDQVRAELRVSKVKSGYSYAVPLPGSSKLEPGEAIVRFQGLPATFWDYAGDGEALFTQLKAGLPALEWTDYAASQAQKPERPQKVAELEGLVFVLGGSGLEVRDATFQSIRFYSRSDMASEGMAIAQTAPGPVAAAPVAVPMTARPEPSSGIVPPGDAAAPMAGGLVMASTAAEGIWRGPEMTGEIVGLDVLDINNDGQNEAVIVFQNKILLGSMTGGRYQGLGFIDIPDKFRLMGIESADLDRNGKPELYVSAVKFNIGSEYDEVKSMVIEEVDGQMQIVADDLPFFFGKVDMPGEGSLIITQRSDNFERTYSGRVQKLTRKENKFKAGEPLGIDNHKITVHGFTPFDWNGNKFVALFDINEKLEVISLNGERLWANNESLGGSQTYIAHPDPNAKAETPMHHFLKARIGKLADGTVLVPLNEGSTKLFYKREFSKSQLIAMQWDGYAMKEVWHTEPQGGYLADFRVADVDNDGKDEIVMGVLFSQGGLLKEVQKRSALVVYELP